MTVYQIDYNRGNDANNGVTLPFKNLSKLSTLVLASLLPKVNSIGELSPRVGSR